MGAARRAWLGESRNHGDAWLGMATTTAMDARCSGDDVHGCVQHRASMEVVCVICEQKQRHEHELKLEIAHGGRTHGARIGDYNDGIKAKEGLGGAAPHQGLDGYDEEAGR